MSRILLPVISLVPLVAAQLGEAPPPPPPFVVGDKCQSLIVDTHTGRPEEIGQVCTEVIGENLEMIITVTKETCLLEETHICNLPVWQLGDLDTLETTYDIPIDDIYGFVCNSLEDTFTVAGHATICCDKEMIGGRRRLQADPKPIGEHCYNGYFEVDLGCPEANPAPALPEGCDRAWGYTTELECDQDLAPDGTCDHCITTEFDDSETPAFAPGYAAMSLGPFPVFANQIKFPFYINGGSCDVSKGQAIGEVTVFYRDAKGDPLTEMGIQDPEFIEISVDLAPGWMISETNLHYGEHMFPDGTGGDPFTYDPSQFPWTHPLPEGVVHDEYTMPVDPNGDGAGFISIAGIVCN